MDYSAPLAYKRMLKELPPDQIIQRDVAAPKNSSLIIYVESITEFAPCTPDTPTPAQSDKRPLIPMRPVLYGAYDVSDVSTMRLQERISVAIEDMPTQLVVCPDFSADEQLTMLALPYDEQDRRCLRITDATTDTEELTAVAVARYYELAGCYPTVIVLSAFRYLTSALAMKSYTPPGTTRQIPIAYEESHESHDGCYDIVVRE